MKARLRFTRVPFFNEPPNKLVCPGQLIGRAEGRLNWTMVFTATKQLSTLVYEGNLRWLIEPSEADFGRGVRFKLISFAGGKLEGKDKDHRDRLIQDKKDRTEAFHAKEAKERKERGEPPIHDEGEDAGVNLSDNKPPDIDMPDGAFADRPPVLQGTIAEGELLG
jgi:hypothetical protein